ncbi:MAG: amidophosphoribosyltransferase [Candidatus Bathyarchaeota archaeon]
MMEPGKREACGIIATLDGRGNVAEKILFGLMALQHRGQESAGIAVSRDDGNIVIVKVNGLAGEGFGRADIENLKGKMGIGHVRYSTAGFSCLENAHPIYLENPRNGLALAHNGTIVNYAELSEAISRNGKVPSALKCDAEVLLHILAEELKKTDDPFEALTSLSSKAEGAYSIACLTGRGELLVFRDPLGFRPLCYGLDDGSFICASESVAIDMCGGKVKRDLAPGEAFLVSESSIERKQFAPCKRRAHCMFEYVYFSRPDSVIEGRSVYEVRLNLGRNLGKTYGDDADVIVPVPDTARPAAEGISRVTGIPVAEGLIKNRYVHRTFIMPEQGRRENAVKAKVNPLIAVLNGQRVLLVDDSIVRGTTLKSIVNMVKKAGAREVHVRITCPPILSPCFYGIDISTHKELIAAYGNHPENICRLLGAETLGYQTLDGLIDAIGLREEDLCFACLTGVYPTPRAQQLADKMKEKNAASVKSRYIELNHVT